MIPSLHTTSLGPWTEIQEFAHGWTKGPTTGRRVKEMYNSWMFYLAFWESSSFCNVCASMYNLFHVVTLIASYQWPKWIETNGYKWWVGDWSKYQWHAESTSQPSYICIYIYSEYDINSQHQTTKISADSCWLPPGESTMLHQFRQTWHEHAWQSIDNSIYNIYTYIYLSVKTAYIIKRVCNEVTSPHEIDLTYQTMSLKQAWPQVNQMICAEMRLRQVW